MQFGAQCLCYFSEQGRCVTIPIAQIFELGALLCG
jgi:hypothetical protein